MNETDTIKIRLLIQRNSQQITEQEQIELVEWIDACKRGVAGDYLLTKNPLLARCVI